MTKKLVMLGRGYVRKNCHLFSYQLRWLNMKREVTFYSDKIEAQTLKFPSGILANFLHLAEMTEELGSNLGKPYVGTLGSGLYET
ncbi:MAG: hypothetical protein DRR42_24385 [Gammaproteobacteria bacterium]|nr:MAG: hypothetical protein DRR42_24385 [Gammaproteobacteria bacterium]